MESKAGTSVSVWMVNASTPSPHLLGEHIHADICIIGAGIAGLSTAYMLAREGRSVVVLDSGHIGGGMTERTTAHLSNAIDDRYVEIERIHGERGARLAAESHTAAINRIEAIISDEQIECEFERLNGYLFAPPGDASNIIEREAEAAHRIGFMHLEQVTRAPIADFDTGPALVFPNQAQFHPLKYLTGLAGAVEREGGRIFTGTHVTDIKGGSDARITTTNGFTVTAAHLVVATNTPINDIITMHTKQAPYTSYVIGARVPSGSVTKALYWDTVAPYHYVRLHSVALEGGHYDLLIVGGEDHKAGQEDDSAERHARLAAWARERFPMIESIDFHWSGEVMEPVDGVAFIGRNPHDADNVYIATGDSGMGMTHGTIAGMLITDLIMGRDCPWESLYDPARKSLRALGTFAKENLNVASQYVEDYLSAGDLESVNEILPGDGAIVRRGLRKFAVYRDEDGRLHECSAVCPHLGCIVSWDSLEKTWDCPCHGSRFDRYGHVIVGPAISGLEAVE